MSSSIPNYLKWSCRRGMLELDILLGNFLEKNYPSLSLDDQLLFQKLLKCEDQLLFEWLAGKRVPSEEFLEIVLKISPALRADPLFYRR